MVRSSLGSAPSRCFSTSARNISMVCCEVSKGWNKLYEFTIAYGIGPWVADGFRRYSDDFFLQPSDSLREQFLALNGERNQELLGKFKLNLMRSQHVFRY